MRQPAQLAVLAQQRNLNVQNTGGLNVFGERSEHGCCGVHGCSGWEADFICGQVLRISSEFVSTVWLSPWNTTPEFPCVRCPSGSVVKSRSVLMHLRGSFSSLPKLGFTKVPRKLLFPKCDSHWSQTIRIAAGFIPRRLALGELCGHLVPCGC